MAQPRPRLPGLGGHDLTARDPSARLGLLASDGATSSMVAGDQLGRLRRLGVIPTLATVTMGGNDLLSAYGDASAARRAIGAIVADGRLVLASLRALMGPDAPTLVATVYDPSDGSGDATRLGFPPCPEALELLAELNRALRALAEDHRALVAQAILRWMGDYAALDPVPGGQFTLDVNGVPVRGRYLEVDRPRRLLLSWGHAGSDRLPPGGSTVEITFTPDADGTVVTVVHSGLPAAEASQHRLGWGHFLARLVIAGGGGDPGPDPWAAQPPAPPIH